MNKQLVSFDWLAYVEKTRQRFIDHFAHLDEGEFPDRAAEIQEARQQQEEHAQAMDKLENRMCRFVLANPHLEFDVDALRFLFPSADEQVLDNFGIKAADVQARIDELKGKQDESL